MNELCCREVLDRVAAVAQDALVAVDERDRRLARARVAVAVVERDVAGLRAELADVDGRLVLRTDHHGQFDGLPVGEFEPRRVSPGVGSFTVSVMCPPVVQQRREYPGWYLLNTSWRCPMTGPK
jgi:hypothetical protein